MHKNTLTKPDIIMYRPPRGSFSASNVSPSVNDTNLALFYNNG